MQSVASHTKMRNLLVTISYDGKELHGWQIQKNATTVQEIFQDSLEKIILNVPDIKGCSRTDSGVHANMYCISMKIDHEIPCERLRLALNRYLPKDIVCLSIKEVPLDFHARYSAKGKEYIYKVWNNRTRNPFLDGYAYHYRYMIDEKLLDREAKFFVGKHDFTSFCTKDNREENNMERTVKYFDVERENDMVYFTVAADGFLYNMVRIMVGTLLKIQQGKIPAGTINDIFNEKDRKKAGPTAPACGLYLNKVFYKD